MSLGESSWSVQPGGGRQNVSPSVLAHLVAIFNVCTKGTPNTVIPIADASSISSLVDTGPAAEEAALLLNAGAPAVYVVPVTPSTVGAIGDTALAGTGTATITAAAAPHKAIKVLCTVGGTLTTAKFKFSLDGGTTYGAEVTSGSATWAYLVPGTFTTLSFAAATYVATKTLTVGVDGTVTAGSGWVGSVTQVSSPVDYYEVVLTVQKAGALGVAVLAVSLDNGTTSEPSMLIPSSGTLVIPGTGLVLTCSGTFVATDVYSFLTCPPGFSTSDLTAATDAFRLQRNYLVSLIHNGALPAAAASAITAASTLDTAVQAAFTTDGLDLEALSECPCSEGPLGDVVVSTGKAERDTADTTAVITAARVGQDLTRTSLFAGTHRLPSAINNRQLLRPAGWHVLARIVKNDPRRDPAAKKDRKLITSQIMRDEAKTPGLDEVQINTLRTYRNEPGAAYLSITKGGFGWKNLTTQDAFQSAPGVRVLNAAIAGLRPIAEDYLGEDMATNADGTIEERTARGVDDTVDGVIKRAVGLKTGGEFSEPQASVATAKVLRSSQLGQAPRRLDLQYAVQRRGFVSSVSNAMLFTGTLSVTGG